MTSLFGNICDLFSIVVNRLVLPAVVLREMRNGCLSGCSRIRSCVSLDSNSIHGSSCVVLRFSTGTLASFWPLNRISIAKHITLSDLILES